VVERVEGLRGWAALRWEGSLLLEWNVEVLLGRKAVVLLGWESIQLLEWAWVLVLGWMSMQLLGSIWLLIDGGFAFGWTPFLTLAGCQSLAGAKKTGFHPSQNQYLHLYGMLLAPDGEVL